MDSENATRLPVVRNSILLGDCLEVLKKFPSNTFSAVITDGPYGLSAQPDMKEVLKHWLAGDEYEHSSSGFMGKGWDSFVPGPKIWEEVMRVLKPGGHILSFSGCRTYDLMVTAMRLAGSEIRDQINVHCELENSMDWIQGQGFPKSLNIGKAIDKMRGAEREVVSHVGAEEPEVIDRNALDYGGATGKAKNGLKDGFDVTAPSTEDAKKWEGYGTALKPAHEPIADFAKGDSKPLEGTPFYYTAKTASKERDAGCKHLFWKMVDGSHVRISEEEHAALEKENEEKKGVEGFVGHRLANSNCHPTVKPIMLCRWLVKMVKMPSDNLILDCFCGSGSILCACALEDCDFIGIDMDPMSVELSKARSLYWKLHGKR